MTFIMKETFIIRFGGSYLISTICIHYCMMSLKAIMIPQTS